MDDTGTIFMSIIRILLLEDNAGDAYLVKEQLRDIDNCEFQIDEAQYLEEALRLLETKSYDAILLDLTLPDSQGLDTFLAINRQAPSTAIVVISAITEEAFAIQAVKAGAQDYLAKGKIQPNALYQTIQYAIERKSVTELLQKRTQELEYANQELQAFNYTVSHDLKNPLSFIKGMSSLLLTKKRSHPLDEQDKMCIDRIYSSSIRMEQITQNLLDLSLAQRSQMSLENINLSEIATQVADFFQQQSERQVKFAIQPDVMAMADKQLITLVLENLLGNAWKYTRSTHGAIIKFGANYSNSGAAYYVRDNGIGFAAKEEETELLFVPFKRLSNSGGFEGTGIGLATVKRIIDRHNGQIWFESEPNQGATFQFTLEANSQ